LKRVMSVATSDSGAGAGIQADLKAFLRCGVYGTTAIVATTAQNTVEVTDIHPFPPRVAVAQMEAVISDIGADAVKTGMLFNGGIISSVAQTVERHGLPNLVVDPVMVAESGAVLLEPQAVETYKAELFPLARAITPNAREAFALLGEEFDEDHIEDCVVTLHALGPENVIVTGGHTASGADLIYDGERFTRVQGPRHPSENTHGSGCTHSSALASFLALGFPVEEAARRARAIAAEAVAYGLGEIGAGAGPVHALGRVLEGFEATEEGF
jgi:hydroxymethylpyrimidine/phosphomethylpyrimidine kinase